MERKTHRKDWTGEKSVKARFPIKEDKVNAFLCGEYTMDEEFKALVEKGKKSQADVDSMLQLTNEVQYAVLMRRLQPGTCVAHSDYSCIDVRRGSYANILQPDGFPTPWQRSRTLFA